MGFRKWARGYACHEAAISKVDPTLGRSVDIAGIEGSVLVEGFNMSETRSERGRSAPPRDLPRWECLAVGLQRL